MRALGLCLALGACNFPVPKAGNGVDAAPRGDARVDAVVDAPPIGSCLPWTTQESVNPCAGDLGTPVSLSLTTGNATFHTLTGVLERGGGNLVTLPGKVIDRSAMNYPSLRVVNLSSLAVDNGRSLTIVGPHAVLFLVHDNVAISGIINASAQNPVDPAVAAPGADSLRCTAARRGGTGTQANDNNKGGGGGGGGGHGDVGGSGGTGFDDRVGGVRGEADGENIPLRGGCAGGRGGDNNDNGSNQGGLGGGGGGAVAISAHGTLAIAATAIVSANGASGRGGAVEQAGGGGGGAGGTILLEGASVTVAGAMCAKGGGGGEGSGDTAGNGGDPSADCSTNSAPGGAMGSSRGGNGGGGGTRGAASGGNGNNGTDGFGVEGGGGGGGGAAGKILLHARPGGTVSVPSTTISPAPVTI